MIREAVDKYFDAKIYPKLVAGEAKANREIAHRRFLSQADNWHIEGNPLLLWLMDKFFTYSDRRLYTRVAGLDFDNPLGYGAGLDKDIRLPKTLGALGFGFGEGGSITATSYNGNPEPRIFLSEADESIINRMGFPGRGLDEVIPRALKRVPPRPKRRWVYGKSVGASRTSVERGTAIEDFNLAFAQAHATNADYLAVNPVSPNTPGLRQLPLEKLLERIALTSESSRPHAKPWFLKLSPDATLSEIDDILKLGEKYRVDGYIATNTTVNQDIKNSFIDKAVGAEVGGASGRVLAELSLKTCRHVAMQVGDRKVVIRSGGVRNAYDYWDAFSIGKADLVQIYTAFVHPRTATPNFAWYMNHDLVTMMKIAGYNSLGEIRKSGSPSKHFDIGPGDKRRTYY